MPRAYYNEIDTYNCQWLRNLIAAGLIMDGDVDERSIEDVTGEDLHGYTRVHLFAGVGGWEYALQLAGWPEDREVWTGSCPCQPFSAAGQRRGTDDPRHLWPHMRRLIETCRPETVFGEQVASAEVVGTRLEAAFVVAVQAGDYAQANRLAHRLSRSKTLHYYPRWLDGVSADLEALGYTLWPDVLGAHSVGAPHIRQRLWWVADCAGGGRQPFSRSLPGNACEPPGREQDGDHEPAGSDATDRLADAEPCERGPGRLCDRGRPAGTNGKRAPEELAGGCGRRWLADAERDGRGPDEPGRGQEKRSAARGAGAIGGVGDADGTGQRERERCFALQSEQSATERRGAGASGGVGDATDDGRNGQLQSGGQEEARRLRFAERPDGISAWGSTWLLCSDGTARRAQPGIHPLAHGIPRGVADCGAWGTSLGDSAAELLRDARRFRRGVLKGAGNAIVPEVAAEFVKAYIDARPD